MKQLLFHPLIVLVITLLVAFSAWSLWDHTQNVRQSGQIIPQLEEQLTDLETEITVLEQKLETAHADETKDRLVRNELLMQKPGEIVLQVPIPEDANPTAAGSSPKKEPEANWQVWLTLLQ